MSVSIAGGERVTTLANGLRVATDAMDGVGTVSLGLWVGAGARDEGPAVSGVSHMLEHMAFKGTRRRSARAIAEEIEAVGGYLNACTTRESTAYFARVLAPDVALAVDILGDILLHSTFDEDELRRERDVVLQEIGQADDTPDDLVFDRFQAAAFPDQPLGRPVLGDAATVRALPRAALVAFMDARYRAGDMVLAAAGRVDHGMFAELAEAAFGALPAGRPPAREAARYRGGGSREARPLEQVHLVLGFGGVAYDDPDYFAAGVLSGLLGGGMSSRLFQEVREARGLAYAVHSFSSSYVDAGLFGVYAGTGPGQVGELVPVLCDAVAGVAAAAPAAEEVNRVRAQQRAGLLMVQESSGARCERLAHQLLVHGRLIGVDELLGHLDAVDAAAVRRVAGRLFAGPPTVAALGPVAELEADADIAARLGAAAA